MATKKKNTGKKLEVEYKRLFSPSMVTETKKEGISLAQPHERKVVPSFVTYGAYEDPI
jgi:hypothetical protein